MGMEDYDYLYKIVLIGDASVGKTNILNQLKEERFKRDSKATIGVEFESKTFKLKDAIVKAQIWDTAGQERFRAITRAYYRGTLGALIVYDVTVSNSFEHAIGEWYNQLQESLTENITIMLVGNKIDLVDQRQISSEQGENVAAQMNILFYETSALTGENINKAFSVLIENVYQQNKKLRERKTQISEKSYSLKGKKVKKTKRRTGCCG